MKKNRLLILSLVTIVAIIAAVLLNNNRTTRTDVVKQYLFPSLVERINNVHQIEIKNQQDTLIVERQNDVWVLPGNGNYPAIFDKVKRTVVSVSELKILAKKTARPALYPKLGVEAYNAPNARSHLLVLRDDASQELASLIVGNARRSSTAVDQPGLYVRLPDETVALLVAGELSVTTQIADWFKKDVLDINSGEIQEIIIKNSDDSQLKISKSARGQTEFTIIDGANDLPPPMLNRVARLLESLSAENVQSVDDFQFPEETIDVVFYTFDGLQINLKVGKQSDKAYAHLTFASVPALSPQTQEKDANTENETQTQPAPNSEAQSSELNAKLSNWVYQIPEFKYASLILNPPEPTDIPSALPPTAPPESNSE